MDQRDNSEKIGAGIILKKGFDFGFAPAACAACDGKCCRGRSGNIWVSEQDIKGISRFLGTNTIDFMRRCIHRVDNRLSIREQYAEDGFRCIFLETRPEARCGIYPVRPRQCRTFPFWDYFRRRSHLLAEECPGIRYFKPQNITITQN